MKIVLTPEIELKLFAFANLYKKEFSGFGFIERDGENLNVYDIVVLDVGSEVFTEIPTFKILELMNRPDAANMKLWFHRHPIDNWSGTDENTIQTSPLGGIPELVKWSASMVLTPHKGWIGRVDSYVTHKTIVCDVVPNYNDWADEALQEILETKPAQPLSRHVWPDWDLEDEEEEFEFEEEDDFEEEQMSLFNKNRLRNSRLGQSSWLKRWLGQ